MSLPQIPQPTAVVRVGDTDMSIRGLTLAEVRQIMSADTDEADALAVSLATGESLDAARAWCAAAPAKELLALIGAIHALCGLSEGAQFPG